MFCYCMYVCMYVFLFSNLKSTKACINGKYVLSLGNIKMKFNPTKVLKP
jgi:hypothetical protein